MAGKEGPVTGAHAVSFVAVHAAVTICPTAQVVHGVHVSPL